MPIASTWKITPGEIKGADGHGNVAARESGPVTFEIPIDQLHDTKKYSGTNCRWKLQGIKRQFFLTGKTRYGNIKNRWADDRQKNIDREADVKNEGNNSDEVKKPLPFLKIKGHTDADDHDVVREIGSIKKLAHRQGRKCFHETDTRLQTEQTFLQSDEASVEIAVDNHKIEGFTLAIKYGIHQYRIKMTQKAERSPIRKGSVGSDQGVKAQYSCGMRRQ